MCGLAGYYGAPLAPAVARARLQAMARSLQHRGPDDEGLELLEEGRAGLVSRRLAILDLSPQGHMPMQLGPLTLVYNGEIYNYLELRRELEAHHTFRSGTDTEVLLAAYRHWGPACLERLNGMFAFALHDQEKRELFCARDRLGIKPLYLYAEPERLWFASELKALRLLPGVPLHPNRARVLDYLLYRHTDHTHETMLEGFEQLPAGHCLVARPDGWRIRRWWTLRLDRQPPDPERFGDLFQDSVRLRLRSDVPVGTALSGGLDSSAVVAAMRRLGTEPRTFTAVYDDFPYDERKHAQAVKPDTTLVYPQAQGLLEELERVLYHADEPIHSASPYAQWCVMRAARQNGVVVMLDGQGADEQLAGYPGYRAVFLAELVRQGRLKDFVRAARPRDFARLLYLAMPRLVRLGLRQSLHRFVPEGVTRAVLQRDLDRFPHELDYLAQKERHPADLGARLAQDMLRFSLPQLLRYEDRNSMAFSVEARTPFLDYRLVELVFGCDSSARFQHGWSKWLLRQAVTDLPDSIRWRRDKLGFVTPEAAWLQQLLPAMLELFRGEPASAAFLDPARVRREWERFDPSRWGKRTTEFFRWVALELWCRGLKKDVSPALS